jgi:hypothetical protein|tara:strand:- start:108 stop:743 length:636 start_codon:yes stop_codon:yes gene_type:complete
MTTASVMTYDSLVENIQSYLERSDTATLDKIPLFIMLAEQIIASQIKFLGNMNVNTSTMVIGQPIIDKPARWHKTVSMNVSVDGVRQPVLLRKYEYLREYTPDATVTGVPAYFGDYDYTHWLVSPSPADAYEFEVLYYERIQPLDSSNQTNWFTIYAPQALLYGSLLQAMPFLKNDERMPMWQQNYDQIIQTLKAEDVQRIGDRQATVLDT